MPASAWARAKAESVCAGLVWTDELVERMALALDEIEAARLKWAIALQSLTPGGSEFQTPEACVETVRRRYAGDHERALKFAKGKKASEAERDRLLERLEKEARFYERSATSFFGNSEESRHRRELARVLRSLMAENKAAKEERRAD